MKRAATEQRTAGTVGQGKKRMAPVKYTGWVMTDACLVAQFRAPAGTGRHAKAAAMVAPPATTAS